MTSPRQKKKKLAILKMLKKKQSHVKEAAVVELMKEKANVSSVPAAAASVDQKKDIKLALKDLKSKKPSKPEAAAETEQKSDLVDQPQAENGPVESENKNEA